MDAVARTLPRVALGLAAATLGLPGETAAQQLWNIEEVAVQPATPIVMDGRAISAAAAGAPSTEAATVQVTYDYLRLGMGYLELPLPDGSVIAAENAVFEDRGAAGPSSTCAGTSATVSPRRTGNPATRGTRPASIGLC